MENTKDILTEFESKHKKAKPIDFFSIIVSAIMSIFFFYIAYEYYDMWSEYHNHERVGTACSYFFLSGFCLSTTLHQIIIRYKFIRKA